MGLKLVQTIAIKYYQAKVKLIALFSKRKAAEVLFDLMCTPHISKSKRTVPLIFADAETFDFDFDHLKVKGWRWKPQQPNGKKILIVHGMHSCSYRFDKYISPLMQDGYEVFAFDAPGHGMSGGKRIHLATYVRAIIKVEALYGSFHGFISHSFGGLATALAFEQFPNQATRKLVLIAPTTETSTATKNFFCYLPVPMTLQIEICKVIEETGHHPVEYYSIKRTVPYFKGEVLWVHDEDDVICAYEDTIPIQEMKLPHVEFFITKGLGHSGIYRQEQVFNKVLSFFDIETLSASEVA